ncbi:MAG: prepilin-type N-terminal cleavage/methylation domain-containing protein, partial [Gemmatimonadota bacterium]
MGCGSCATASRRPRRSCVSRSRSARLMLRNDERESIMSRNRGFTLIEILVVIVVLGVLAGLVAPNVFRHVFTAKDAAARSQIEMLGAALDA